MTSGLHKLTTWRWMPCAALSLAATGFAALALLLTPNPDENDPAQARFSDNAPLEARTDVPAPVYQLNAARAATSPRGFDSSSSWRPPPSAPVMAVPAPDPQRVDAPPPVDVQPMNSQFTERDMVNRANYGIRRFADFARPDLTNEAANIPPPPVTPANFPPPPVEPENSAAVVPANGAAVPQNTPPTATALPVPSSSVSASEPVNTGSTGAAGAAPTSN
mgnify:CR=1 FL=1